MLNRRPSVQYSKHILLNKSSQFSVVEKDNAGTLSVIETGNFLPD